MNSIRDKLITFLLWECPFNEEQAPIVADRILSLLPEKPKLELIKFDHHNYESPMDYSMGTDAQLEADQAAVDKAWEMK